MNNNEAAPLGMSVFILIISLIFAGIGAFVSFFKLDGYVKTRAVITNIEREYIDSDTTSYTVYVDYMVDGQRYSGVSDVYESGYKVGKRIDIYYNPDDPTDIHGNSSIVGYFFLGIGGVSALFSVVMIINSIKAKRVYE